MSDYVRPSAKGNTRNSIWLVLLFAALMLADCRPAAALPAFARKYGMPCSSCHEAWPKLSPFGQNFKDNGYQMMNERDAPIFQNASYWPVTFRITPIWHRESNNRVQVDTTPPVGPIVPGEAQITTHGFDWTGLDFHTAGTLAKNVSFYVLPSSDNTGAFHFESVWARFDNLLGSSWLNIKLGKFELDNLHSEKRTLTLSPTGGGYYNYHFQPVGESLYTFGLGDNQVGLEWMGHSKNDRTRVSASLLSSTDGKPNLPASTYDAFFAASRAFEFGSFGVQRVGGFAYIGQAATYPKYTSGGGVAGPGPAVPGTGTGNKPFYRVGLIGMWYFKKLDITTMYFHGSDNVYLGTNTPANATLPTGAHAPNWNGGLFETHYNLNPQLILINRYELVRMSQQALDSTPGDQGNLDVVVFGYRYYPFISSRAGFAFHNEYALLRRRKVSPVNFLDVNSSSLLLGFDFAF